MMLPTEIDRRAVLRSVGAGTALLVGGVGAISADDDTDDQGDGTTAEVRVGHLSPDTPPVDVYVGAPGLDPADEDTSPTIEWLSYPNFAPNAGGTYLDLDAGTYDVSVTPAGVPSVEAIDVDGLELAANSDNTILAVGELAPEAATFGEADEPGIRPLPLVDNDDEDTALPPADATLLRAVHASPDAGAVDIVVSVDGNEAARLEGVTFGTAGPYLEAPADATVAVEKNGSTVLGPIANPLDDGQKGSAYVVGNVTPEDGGDGPLGAEVDDAPLEAVTTLDATSPARGRGRGDDPEDEDEEDEQDGDGDEDERGERGEDDE